MGHPVYHAMETEELRAGEAQVIKPGVMFSSLLGKEEGKTEGAKCNMRNAKARFRGTALPNSGPCSMFGIAAIAILLPCSLTRALKGQLSTPFYR